MLPCNMDRYLTFRVKVKSSRTDIAITNLILYSKQHRSEADTNANDMDIAKQFLLLCNDCDRLQ